MLTLIPSYEPDQRLVELVTALRGRSDTADVLVVNDGSGPAYDPVFAGATSAGATVIGYRDNRGKGHALKIGFAWALRHRPDTVVVCADSDGQHTPEDIAAVARATQLARSSLVLGVRDFSHARPTTGQEKIPARSRLGNLTTSKLVQLATGEALSDTQTGLRGCPAEMLAWLIQVPGEGFDYELRVLLGAREEGWTISQVPIATIYSEANASSHFKPIRDSARIYAPLLRRLVRTGPGRLAAFGASSFLGFLIDFAMLMVLHAITGGLLVSVVGARIVSAGVNYLVNDRMVFAHRMDSAGALRSPLHRSLPRYAALAVTLLSANYALMWLGTVILGLPLAVVKLATEALLFVTSFMVQRRVVFPAPGTLKGPPPRDGDDGPFESDQRSKADLSGSRGS